MPNSNILEVQDLQKVFFPGTANQRHILKDINLTIHSGDFISVIGNNGAGKSTLLNTIAGTLPADAGSIKILDNPITNKSIAYRSKWISRVFQDPKLGTASNLTVAENLALSEKKHRHFNLHFYHSTEREQRFIDLLKRLNMGLEKHLKTQVKFLSGGQRQALSLLMATLSQPDLLLLDEHTAALDPKTSSEVMRLTNEIVTERQLTALMITHKMEDALKYGNRLLMIQDGQIKLDVSGADKAALKEVDLLKLFDE